MDAKILKSLVILSSDPRAVEAAEQFLLNRDWTIFRTTDEKEALRALAERRPSCFMISVEHPNRRVRNLHRILKTTAPEIAVVYFSEHNHIEAYRALSRIDHPERVQAPVTGPAVERAFQRHLKALRERDREKRAYRKVFEKALGGESPPSVRTPSPLIPKDGLARIFSQALGSMGSSFDIPKRRLQGKSERFVCVLVENSGSAGCLLVAAADGDFVNESFVKRFREKIGVLAGGETFSFEVPGVHFEKWALRDAGFFQKTVDEGQEVAVAFFPSEEDFSPSPTADVSSMMSKIQLKDIPTDEVLKFRLYLPFPANGRELLYTPKGRPLLAEQKDRLLKKGVAEMHVPREDLSEFRKARAKARIRNQIEVFESSLAAA